MDLIFYVCTLDLQLISFSIG